MCWFQWFLIIVWCPRVCHSVGCIDFSVCTLLNEVQNELFFGSACYSIWICIHVKHSLSTNNTHEKIWLHPNHISPRSIVSFSMAVSIICMDLQCVLWQLWFESVLCRRREHLCFWILMDCNTLLIARLVFHWWPMHEGWQIIFHEPSWLNQH